LPDNLINFILDNEDNKYRDDIELYLNELYLNIV